MCGRKTLTKGMISIIEELAINEWIEGDHEPSFNIAPTQNSPVMINKKGSRIVRMMKWGLIPHWSKDSSRASRMINARSETLLQKISYKDLVHSNRCIIITDGYFEWKKHGKRKFPYYMHHPEKTLLLMAGLWTSWRSSSTIISTYTVITTTPNKNIAHIHNRMPAILNKNDVDTWLNCDTKDNIRIVLNYLRPFCGPLSYHPVSNFVNSTKNNNLNCIQPLDESNELNLF